MRLTLVISGLGAGGAERIMSVMANYWVSQKDWQITLLTLHDDTIPPFYSLDVRVKYIPLGVAGFSPNPIVGIGNNIKRIQKLRSAIMDSQPYAVISFMDRTNILTLLATWGLKIPIIISEHVYPTCYPIGQSWELLRQLLYPKANRIVVLTERIKSYFRSEIQSQTVVIPYPVLPPSEIDVNSANTVFLQKPAIIAMGRLAEQKGFDLLLRAFAKVKTLFPEWSLTILGEGVLRSNLEDLRHELGLNDCVNLPGLVKNPYVILRQADLFVMSSRFEGFPNALCEAMACGLPVISTDCPSGPREIIQDGIDGILVPNGDVEALAAAMNRLILNHEERKNFGLASQKVTERFSLDRIMTIWEQIINQVVHTH
ncbi:glycosyltransferase family 4 protein [[Phormidium] sp. ETS-05]|uniref:glycosyltransferase family 4 protein n=1 Tax=[Phormidium] sp. ETS-05 TaxID=222819 RepID=UPI0018EF11C3|nr:glycosyltransferase family 4 protein [[Phormidium] sp. ETS-05]